jgi:hypothetical protein
MTSSFLRWDNCETFEPGFHLGSEGDDGEHLRDPDAGWPYSVYRRSTAIGQSDVVICHGIHSRSDAAEILERLQCLS